MIWVFSFFPSDSPLFLKNFFINVMLSLELTRVKPDRNIFSITSTFFLLYRGLVHHHHLILNQEYIFKPKPKQNCTTHLLRNCWNYLLKKKCQLYTKIKAWKLVFDDTWFHLRTYLFETIIEFQLMWRFWNISWLWDNYSNLYQCQFSSI